MAVGRADRGLPRVVRICLVVDVALAFVYVADFVLGRPWRLSTWLVDLNAEGNLPAVYSSAQLFAIGALLADFARVRFDRARSETWALPLLAGLFLFLGLDELTSLHGWLGVRSDALLPSGTRRDTLFRNTGIWMLLMGPPVLVLVAVLGWRARVYLRVRGVRLKLGAGLALLFGSALGTEVLSNFTQTAAESVGQIVAEELGEMVGATVVLWGVLELVACHGHPIPAALTGPPRAR